MKKYFLLLMLLILLIQPVSAMEFTAPAVPESAEQYMPDNQESFAQGLWYILKSAISEIRPEISKAFGVCLSLIVAVLLISVLGNISERESGSIQLAGAVIIGVLLLQPANTLIQLGANTVTELSNYGKLLLPVMTAAVAAQGGVTSSAALYTGTVFFDSLLTSIISRVIIPAIYIYLCLSITNSAVGQDMLKKIKDLAKWAMTWCLKTILYIFSGYLTITRVVSGVVDASALKAAKLTISGIVPVVGGILSDASETILVSAGVMKSSAGIYGIFAMLAVCVSPFLQIGLQYLLLKLSCGVCSTFGSKSAVTLLGDFTSAMGLVLAMTGTVCILLLISLVCFMKGING